jgi:hypothetical protein
LGNFSNLDWAVDAKKKLRQAGCTPTSFTASADTVATLEQLKQFTGTINSNQPLIANTVGDVTASAADSILGVPLVAAADGTNLPNGRIWGLDKTKVFTVIRRDVSMVVDPSFFFGSDSLAVRVTCRVGFGFPHHQAIVQIGSGGS